MFNTFVQAFNRAMNMISEPVLGKRQRSTAAVTEARRDRKAAILLAAEKLFAQTGYHAVTIRQIAEEAGVPLALVGYYYGQKHELFEAIFEHWNPTIEERLRGLLAAVKAGGPELLHNIVEAFVEPVLRMRSSAEGEFYALLVARELSYASPEADRVLRKHFDPLARAYIQALQVALPHVSVGDAAWAYQFALGALLHHMSDHRVGRLSEGANTPNDPAARSLLISFIVGGMRAALPSSVPSTRRSTHRRQL